MPTQLERLLRRRHVPYGHSLVKAADGEQSAVGAEGRAIVLTFAFQRTVGLSCRRVPIDDLATVINRHDVTPVGEIANAAEGRIVLLAPSEQRLAGQRVPQSHVHVGAWRCE